MSGVYADLQTLSSIDVVLTPSTPVSVPFSIFAANSGLFAFTANGAFTMPESGFYQVRLSCTVFNSADTEEMESTPTASPSPAQLIAFMAYSGTSIANTTTFFKIQPAETSTCVVTTNIVGYEAGTEINASLQAGAGTSLVLKFADLSVSLLG